MGQGPVVSDHYRPTNHAAPDGVYRVVGVDSERVTLLRVGDDAGRRVHTGTIESVARDDFGANYTDAKDPDETGHLPRLLSGIGLGLLFVAAVAWSGLLTAPAPPPLLALLGGGLILAGRLLTRSTRLLRN